MFSLPLRYEKQKLRRQRIDVGACTIEEEIEEGLPHRQEQQVLKFQFNRLSVACAESTLPSLSEYHRRSRETMMQRSSVEENLHRMHRLKHRATSWIRWRLTAESPRPIRWSPGAQKISKASTTFSTTLIENENSFAAFLNLSAFNWLFFCVN